MNDTNKWKNLDEIKARQAAKLEQPDPILALLQQINFKLDMLLGNAKPNELTFG
jgi:hypothetical protein